MASNNEKTATVKVDTKKKATVTESVYTVEEFAKAYKKLDASTPDIVNAAFACAGKKEATLTEAKKLVMAFKTKEVK